MGMRNSQNAMSAVITAVGTASINAVDNTPLTGADLARQLKKDALDIYDTRAKFSEAMGEPDNTVGRYFRNERVMPTDFLLRAITLLGRTPEQVFADAREPRSHPTKGD